MTNINLQEELLEDELQEDNFHLTPRQLFDKYIYEGLVHTVICSGGKNIGSVWFSFQITKTDPEKLYAEAIVLDGGLSQFFRTGSEVQIVHNWGECYRMVLDEEDHGQGFFLGESYGGIGVGS